MALETGSYTNDLVVTNPVASDGLGQTDDHLRLIKAAIKNTFAGFTTSAALNATQAQLDAAVAAVAGTTALPFKVGTALLPGLFPVGDPDTGIYAPAANQLGLAVGGVAIANISSTGIGVTGSVLASGGLAGAAIASTGAYSGGTGQLVPIGSSHIWHDDVLPAEGGYCWANGGTLLRATNPILFARWGTKYGVGDGSTTFNVPNLCEVVPVGQRAMGGVASRALLATGVLGNTTLGVAGGTITLATANLPPYTPAGTITNGAITVNGSWATIAGLNNNNGGGGGAFSATSSAAGASASQAASSFAGSPQGGVSTPISIVQPSMAVNFIIRIG